MTKYNGLFLKAKAMAVLVLMALLVPHTIFAQSDQAARIQIQGGDSASFGDMLAAVDGDDIVLYGLNESVPGSSVVTIQSGDQTFERNANFFGKFPTRFEAPIRIVGGVGIGSATITATVGATTVTGTVNLDLTSPDILQNLITYQDLSRQGNVEEARIQGVPPHRLLNITAIDAANQSLVGKVLLTQKVIGSGSDAIIVDEIEGVSDGGFDVANRFQSVPEFSSIGVYTNLQAAQTGDRSQRIDVIETQQFFEGTFVSNGSFLPFTIEDANHLNNGVPSIFFRISVFENGVVTQVIVARIDNDIEATVTNSSSVNNNVQDTAGAPGSNGIATIGGTADPYSVVTAYADNNTSADVLAQGNANASGAFTLTVPGIFGEDGTYTSQPSVFLGVIDVFGNENGLTQVDIDSESVVFTAPTAVGNGDGTFTVSGVAEPSSVILVTGMTVNNQVVFHAGNVLSEADGSFSIIVPRAFTYTVSAIDQAGNRSADTVVNAEQSTINPTNLAAVGVFPNIQISGTVEANSDVLVFAFPLNQVPDAATTEDNQPANSFFVTGSVSNASGAFTVSVPGSISRVIYIQSVDPIGNRSQFVGLNLDDALGQPISRNLVVFRNLSVLNNPPGIDDVLTGQVVDANSETPVTGLFVNAFLSVAAGTTESPANFPFAEPLSTPEVAIAADGTFSLEIPDISPLSEQFVEDFYLVAMERRLEDFSFVEVGFTQVDETAGFDRVGPRIEFAPSSDDLQLVERGCGVSDILNIRNILPAGTGSTAFDLPADALPFIFILADGNDDAVIDVRSPETIKVDLKPLDALIGAQYGLGNLPFPGVTGINLGSNCWDAINGTVRGNSVVFIALVDAAGNLSPNPLPVFLDVEVIDPDTSKITARGVDVFGSQGSVESFATVSVFSNADKSGFIGSTQATSTGAFAISDLSIQETEIYISIRDQAGNESNTVRLKVNEPVLPPQGSQFLVLDQLGLIHTSSTTLSSGISSGNGARALANVKGNPSLFYVLQADGTITRIGESGKSPLDSEVITISGKFARDLVVVNSDPFQGYVLLGNGTILSYGGAPFFGDMVSVQNGSSGTSRLRFPDSNVMFEDTNGNGQFDTEDANGNGTLDFSVDFNGQVTTEDTNGNGVLDSEPVINPTNLAQGFENDIARELEVVTDSDGNVRGYVIMDGFGTLWPFGSDIGAENVRPTVTNGSFGSDIARAFELILSDEGRILDFILLSGNGQVFGFPGGLLKAGAATDSDNAGHLSVIMGATNFGFDIARDIRLNPDDSNEDGVVNYNDGFYILDGFGGVHAIGGAPDIEGAPFLGFDVARDLEFGFSVLR